MLAMIDAQRGRAPRVMLTLCANVLALATSFAAAQSPSASPVQAFPSKPIRFIVPFPAGGSGDIVARSVGQKLAESWGQPVVIDNRPGATGSIGLQIAARAAPDGHTIVLGTSSTHAINPNLQADLPYHPEKDFSPVALLIVIPNILVAHPSVPARTIQELIELARAKPGQLTFASNGTGTSSHMAGELLKRSARIAIVHVPYKGAGLAINDVMGGHVHLLFGAVATSLPHVNAGKLRALAVTSAQRSPVAPDLPTVNESGLPGFEVVQWFGAFAPAKTPAPILAKLNAEIVRALDLPEVKDRLVRLGFDVAGGTPDKLAAFMRDDAAKWSKLIKEARIRAD